MHTRKPPAICTDSRADAILRAAKEWYRADEANASHPLRYFAKLFSDSRKLRLLQRNVHEVALLSSDQQKAITGLFLPSQHYVKFDMTSVQPAQTWVGDSVTIDFRIENRLLEATSGVVTADITQGLQATIAGAGFQSGAVNVAQLQPGQVSNGTIVLKHWNASPSFVQPGSHNIWLQYWVEDPDGTISVVSGLLGPDQIVRTYSSIAIASGEIDVYPKCKPNGPDFIAVTSFSIDPQRVITDASGNNLAPGQNVTFNWSVAGGGFPATDKHPGSISSVTLDFPLFHGAVPASGPKTIDVSNELAAAYNPINATLSAVGNCGSVASSASLLALPPPPMIVEFFADPPSVAKGQTFTLWWRIKNFPWGNKKALAWLYIFSYEPNTANAFHGVGENLALGSPGGPSAPAHGSFSIKAVADRDYELWVYTQSIDHTGEMSAFKRIAVKVMSESAPIGYSGVRLYNCSDLRHQFHVWVKDLTTNVGWIEKATIDSQWDQDGITCPVDADVFTTVKFDATGHDYEVRVTDPQAPNASGKSDPEDGAAIRWVSTYHALTTGPLAGGPYTVV